jgi:hypothetical protein
LSQIIFKNELFRKKLIVKIYNFKQIFKKKNKESSLFDYNALILNSKFYCTEYYKGNALYGIGKVIKEYCDYDKKVLGCIEHGVYFGDYINEKEAIKSGLPAVLTYGTVRNDMLRKKKSKKLIFKIGPYIKYANLLLTDDEIKNIKKKNGKTLLVFPTHSVDRVETEFDYNGFINEIKKFKERYNFKTVLVSLYYRDIELGKNKIYEDNGFIVVSNGLKEDYDFLSRQKTFITLSDYTISNSVGTHIGYSVALGIPHTIIKQKMEYKSDSKFDVKDVPNLYLESSILQKKEVEEYFLKYSEEITKEQLQVCNKYWGLGNYKTKEQMLELLTFLAELSKKSNYHEEKYNNIFMNNYSYYKNKYSKINEDLEENMNFLNKLSN